MSVCNRYITSTHFLCLLRNQTLLMKIFLLGRKGIMVESGKSKLSDLGIDLDIGGSTGIVDGRSTFSSDDKIDYALVSASIEL